MPEDVLKKLNELEEKGEVLVIRPSESLGIKRTEKDPEELERVYQCGRSVAQAELERVFDFLK